ncbi:MAG: hypothetical protein FWB72_06840 [Firmicutes bacterium]|nr:hypothetical protein [Bacillota bacterium]
MPTITITEKELQTEFVKALESKKPAKVKIAEREGVFISKEEYEAWVYRDKKPNAETLVALQESEDMLAGKIPAKVLKNVSDMRKWLDE